MEILRILNARSVDFRWLATAIFLSSFITFTVSIMMDLNSDDSVVLSALLLVSLSNKPNVYPFSSRLIPDLNIDKSE